jgi:hypothetical protein
MLYHCLVTEGMSGESTYAVSYLIDDMSRSCGHAFMTSYSIIEKHCLVTDRRCRNLTNTWVLSAV